MIITKEDISRKVVDGFGNIKIIKAFDKEVFLEAGATRPNHFPVFTGDGIYTVTGKSFQRLSSALHDLVEFVDEHQITITDKDIGRKVRINDFVDDFVDDSNEDDLDISNTETSLSLAIKETKDVIDSLNSVVHGEASARTLGISFLLSVESDQISITDDFVDRSDFIKYLKDVIKILES